MTLLLIIILVIIGFYLHSTKYPYPTASEEIDEHERGQAEARAYIVRQYEERREQIAQAQAEWEENEREEAMFDKEQAELRYEHFDERAAELGAMVDHFEKKRSNFDADDEEYIKLTTRILTLRNQLNTAENQRVKAKKDIAKAEARLSA